MQTAQLDARGRPATLALGFGTTQARRSPPLAPPRRPTSERRSSATSAAGRRTTSGLTRPATARAVHRPSASSSPGTYYLSANVLKASEDKTFPGAIVASLASPWGQAVQAGDPAQTLLRLLPRGVRPRPVRDVHRAARRRRRRHRQGHRAVPVRAAAAAGRVDAAQQPGQRQARARLVRRPARRGRLPDPDGPHRRADRRRVLRRPHQAGRRLRGGPRPGVRDRALGGAERLLAVHDRGRDRRAGRRRCDRRAQR